MNKNYCGKKYCREQYFRQRIRFIYKGAVILYRFKHDLSSSHEVFHFQ